MFDVPSETRKQILDGRIAELNLQGWQVSLDLEVAQAIENHEVAENLNKQLDQIYIALSIYKEATRKL